MKESSLLCSGQEVSKGTLIALNLDMTFALLSSLSSFPCSSEGFILSWPSFIPGMGGKWSLPLMLEGCAGGTD